jgi:hypothetical protein
MASSLTILKGMAQTKEQRLALIFEIMDAAPRVATADEAYQLLCRSINEIEEKCSGVSCNPSEWREDGRIYPPQEDNENFAPGRPGVKAYRSFKHRTYISSTGALKITRLTGEVVFSKPGKDGRSVG